jgi:hypothetical protein
MLRETERRLEPANLLALAYTQAEPLLRMPRRIGQLAARLETGTLKIGIQPTGLHELEHVARSVANRLGAAMIISALRGLGADGTGERDARHRRLRPLRHAGPVRALADPGTPGDL